MRQVQQPLSFAWNVGAALSSARRLATGFRFDPEVEGVVAVAAVIDRIYGRGAEAAASQSLRRAS